MGGGCKQEINRDSKDGGVKMRRHDKQYFANTGE